MDLQGVPDHLFSHNGLTFFGDTIGRKMKLHPNMERCVRLDVARLLVVMNLEEPLPASIKLREHVKSSQSAIRGYLHVVLVVKNGDTQTKLVQKISILKRKKRMRRR